MNQNLKESIIIIDNYLNDEYAEQVYKKVTSLEYQYIKFNSEVRYEIYYNFNKIVVDIFNNSEFFEMVNQKLSTNVTAILEHHVSKMTPGEYIDNHLDKRDRNQLCTFLLYLNKDWNKDDGGELEMKDSIFILPIFNRLVVFNNTDYSIHRVNHIKTNKTRYAITGWLYNDRDQNNN